VGGLIRAVLSDRLRIPMKSAFLSTFVVAVLTMTLVVQNAIADTTFDGTWFVTVNAHQYENPDGSTALAWVMNFPAEVKNGVLHGEHGTKGAPAWLEIDGKIDADGTANLTVKGITKTSEHAAKRPRPGTPYEWQVIAQFKGRHGTGKTVGPRVRIFTFAKD
jgi:hypothetical protein